MYQPIGIKKAYHQSKRYLAKKWLNLWQPLQIGITGSQGKTSTTQILAKILSFIGSTTVTNTNLDTTFNVPITALKVRPWTRFLVWELGVDHIGEMDSHLEIAHPKIGIITGISPVHTDEEHFGSLENVIKEKRKLIEKLPDKKSGGVAILNFDDLNVRKMAPKTKAEIVFYGSDKKNCHYCFDKNSVKISLSGTVFKLSLSKKTNQNKIDKSNQILINDQLISTKLLGEHFVSNLTAIFSVLDIILKKYLPQKVFSNLYHLTKSRSESFYGNQVSPFSILNHMLSKIEPLRGRMNIENGPLETIILNDSLRANPRSTDEGLKTFYQINYSHGKKIAILGVMGELFDPVNEHKKTADTLIKYRPDIIIGVGQYRKYTIEKAINNGFPKDQIFYAEDVFQAAEILKKIIRPKDFLYLKSSLLRNLWRIIKILNNEKICCRQELCPYKHCGF